MRITRILSQAVQGIFGKKVTPSQANQISQKALALGRWKLDYLMQDLNLEGRARIQKVGELGRELCVAIEKMPQSKLIAVAALAEAEEITAKNLKVLPVRDNIILEAQRFLKYQYGMSRRSFMRFMGAGAAVLGADLSPTRFIFSPNSPQFSLSILGQQIAAEIRRALVNYEYISRSMVGLHVIRPKGKHSAFSEFDGLVAEQVVPSLAGLERGKHLWIGMSDRQIQQAVVEGRKAFKGLVRSIGHFVQLKEEKLNWIISQLPNSDLQFPDFPDFEQYFEDSSVIEVWDLQQQNQAWPIPWLGVQDQAATWHSGTDLPFLAGTNYQTTLPWEVNLL